MLSIKKIITYLEEIAPLCYQADYDNAGLLVGDKDTRCRGIIICLDVTKEVLQEASDKNCNLIISHHPLIFRPLKKLTGQDEVTSIIQLAIQQNIAIYAIHTNLDHVSHGVNWQLGKQLGLENMKILAPFMKSDTSPTQATTIGAGMIGNLPTPLSPAHFLAHLKKSLATSCIRYTPTQKPYLTKIAICGGSGVDLLPTALELEADAFITADIKYHTYFSAKNRLLLADIGHYESEVGTKQLLYDLLFKKFANIALFQCTTITNPIHYYV